MHACAQCMETSACVRASLPSMQALTPLPHAMHGAGQLVPVLGPGQECDLQSHFSPVVPGPLGSKKQPNRALVTRTLCPKISQSF